MVSASSFPISKYKSYSLKLKYSIFTIFKEGKKNWSLSQVRLLNIQTLRWSFCVYGLGSGKGWSLLGNDQVPHLFGIEVELGRGRIWTIYEVATKTSADTRGPTSVRVAMKRSIELS